MKRLKTIVVSLPLLLVMVTTTIYSQEFIVGGSFSQQSDNYKNQNQIVTSDVSANTAYIFYDGRVAVGFQFNYGITYAGFYNDKERMNEHKYYGLYFRFHETLTEDEDKLKYYIEPYIGFTDKMLLNGGHEYNKDYVFDDKNVLSYGINYGLLYFVHDNIALDLYLGGFNFNELKSSVILDFTSIRLGVKFYLPTNKHYKRMF